MRLIQTLLIIAVASVASILIGQPTVNQTGMVNDHGSHQPDAPTKAAVFKTLDNYMSTFNARNLAGWEGTYHFPHYRLAGGRMSVLEKAGLRDSATVFGALERSGWHHSKWEHRNIVHASADKGMLIRSFHVLVLTAGRLASMNRFTYSQKKTGVGPSK